MGKQRVVEVEQREDVGGHGRGVSAGYNRPVIEAAIVTAIAARLTSVLARPTGHFLRLVARGCVVGWLDPARASRLATFPDIFVIADDAIVLSEALNDEPARTAALDQVARQLSADGLLSAWRNERYAVAAAFDAEPIFLLERAAARYFGIVTHAAHVNGLVRGTDGPTMWIARRSPTKAIDPGMLDNLVGGGIAAGHTVAGTVVKEAWEEAGAAADLAATACRAGTVHICRAQPDGLQRETIHVHDLWLPAEFVPHGQDGEVVAHRLVSLAEAARLIALGDGPDVVTADASLVVLDCLIRHGAIAADAPAMRALDALRHPALELSG